MALPERYQGRPILIVVENYALAVIGELSDEKLAGIGQTVRRIWGGDDDWMLTVREQLDWNDTIDATIARNWDAYRMAESQQRNVASPVEFAMMFADEIFRQSASG